MAKTLTPINVATDTLETVVITVNTIIDTIGTEVMTANINANGAFATGNSQLFGNFTANVVAVYNELRGGNIQATGLLSISSAVDIGNSLVVDNGLTVTVGGIAINAGGLDVQSGISIFSANIDLEGTASVILDADNDTYITSPSDDVIQLYVGATAAFVQNATTTSLTTDLLVQGGIANVGVDHVTPGILRLFGGANTETSGELYIYNAQDHDTNADYWLLTGENGTGDFLIGDPGKTDAFRIDETTFLTTLANGLTVSAANSNFQDFVHIDDQSYTIAPYSTVAGAFTAGFTVISQDAGIDIVSDGTASWGSGIGFKEANTSAHVDNWSIIRQTSSGGDSSLRFTYGTSASHSANPAAIRLDTSLGVTVNNGLTISQGNFTHSGGGIATFGGNVILSINDRILLDTDNDSYLYASADDNVILGTSGATRLNVNATAADFQSTIVRTGGDVFVDTDSGYLRAGAGTSNVVANSSLIRLANSTVTFDLTKPTAAQQAANNYYLQADGSWSLVQTGTTIDTTTSTTATQEVANFEKATFRSAEYTFQISDTGANNRQVAKVLVIHDDSITNAYITEYGVTTTNTNLGTFSANCNTTHCKVYLTPTVAATTVKGPVTYIDV